MDILQKIESLLQKMHTLPPLQEQETTIFSIGSQGYYENPTSDILAFFLDGSAVHGLGTLVLEALIDTLPEDLSKIDCSLSFPPEREVKTKQGKRIDLLLESEQWVMVIENKVFHATNNPFSEYEKYVLNRFKNKRPIFVILSPHGDVPSKCVNWVGINYPRFIESLKQKLASHFIAQPMNKWLFILRDFSLHLENIMSTPNLCNETLHFVLDNLAQIKQAQDLKINTIKQYQQHLQQQLQTELQAELNSTVVHWHGFPAIRFAYSDWPTNSDVVLFLDGREGKSFCINYYSNEINCDDWRKIADKHYQEQDCYQPWNEVRNTCRCYKARIEHISLENIRKKIIHKLRLMDTFERKIRPTLT